VIQFFFDYVSPYAYLAWTQIHAIAREHGEEVEPVPVLFAGLLEAHGTRGPAEVPARRRYLMKDVPRIAITYGVPVNAPFAHPFNPLLALRVSSLPMPADVRRALVDGLYRATWVERRRVVDADVVDDVARAAGYGDGASASAVTPESKERVRAQTERAIQAGVFGVPTMVADGELFWGCDSLPHLRRHLSGDLRIPDEWVTRWADLPADAVRRGRGPP
jgi:2-hydroxychromene-2-carboxylate isomerase